MPSTPPSSLVKYCSGPAALTILDQRTLRWSAPHLFGDPFELHHATPIDVTAPRLLEILLREALIMLFGPDSPTGRSNKLVNVMARWREEQRFCDEEEASMVLRELLGQIAELQARQVDEYMANWRSYSRTVRIACFAARPDLVRCWQRFADNHAGVALRFDCGADTALPLPRQVTYQATAPTITSLREQIDGLLGRGPAPDSTDFQQKLLRKNRYDHAEQEWRCFDNDRDDPDSDEASWFSDRSFPAHELRAVYFGVRCSEDARAALTQLVRERYPRTLLYQAQPVPGRFELEFVQLRRHGG
ncbi:MAG: DUF2971 domain-containing protein [Spongiibacteraceae bacterium]|nr:DUF2971 domain-containing protein [Spongiibacteraceae bacterium]